MELNDNFLLWSVLGLFLVLAELFTPGFVVLFFGLGAFAASLSSALVGPKSGQELGIFLVVSMVTLFAFRKYLLRSFAKNRKADIPSNADLRGHTGILVTDIDPHKGPGKVEINGTYWTCEAQEIISEGEMVVVVSRRDSTLIVKKANS